MARVLVVDSRTDEIAAIAGILEKEGYNIDGCEDVDTGMVMIREKEPDLILLDLDTCPAFDLQKVLSAPETSSVPVIVLASDHDDLGLVRCLAALWFGARDYVLKPISEVELVQRSHGQMQLS